MCPITGCPHSKAALPTCQSSYCHGELWFYGGRHQRLGLPQNAEACLSVADCLGGPEEKIQLRMNKRLPILVALVAIFALAGSASAAQAGGLPASVIYSSLVSSPLHGNMPSVGD